MKRKLIILLSVLYCGLFQASDIFKAIESKNQRVIQSWLKYNPDIEMVNDQGQTVLIKAVLAENKSLVRTLLKKGVSVNVIDQFGRTALDYAVELSNKNIAGMLVKNKAMVTKEVNAVKCQKLVFEKYSCLKKAFILLMRGLSVCAVVVSVIFGLFAVCTVVPLLETSIGTFLVMAAVDLVVVGGICYGIYRLNSHAFDKNFEHEICVLP